MRANDLLIHKAAWLYYTHNLRQDEVARALDISRASVAAYLRKARETGIVSISASTQLFRDNTLARRVEEALGLDTVWIVPEDRKSLPCEVEIPFVAASALTTLIERGNRIGVAWGRTVYNIADAMDFADLQDVTVMQLCGNLGAPYSYRPDQCTMEIARRLNARGLNFYAPLVLTSERLARTYASLLTSRPVLEETANRLGISPDGLGRNINVTPIRDTQLLTIKVESPDPALAAAIANTLPQVFIELNSEWQLGRVIEARATLEQEINNTLDDIARTQQELKNTTDEATRARLEASLAQYRTTYSTLVASYQQAKLTESQSINNIVIAEPAATPVTPIRPRTGTNTLLAAVVGAMIALGAAFLIEYLDDTIKTPDDVSRVSGLSTLGAIARLKEGGQTRQLIAWLRTKAPETEAYRTLRTNIQFSSVDKPLRTLLVTSSGPGEGKSTTTANLAVVLAQAGKHVVVVDSDLRRPMQHKIFGVPNNTGLTTALLNGDAIHLEGHLQQTEIEKLQVLTSGPIPPNPSELLGSQRMARLIEALTQRADIVLFDSPPVLAATDARHYAPLAENTYRFMPVYLTAEDLERIHGKDERISMDAHVQAITFYGRLLQQL